MPGPATPDYLARLAKHRQLVAEVDRDERAKGLPQAELFQLQPPAPTDPEYPGDDVLVGLVCGALKVPLETARAWLEQYPHFPL
jgi:hypothetical protein